MFRHNTLIKLVLTIMIIFGLVACSSDSNNEEGNTNNNSSSGTKTIGSLNIGDRVVDKTWSWEFRHGWGYTNYGENEVTEPVVWIVVAKDHNQANSVTLMTENLLGYLMFDATTLNGIFAGYNHWGNSGQNASVGIRPWLNSTSPHEGEGFYTSFSSSFKGIVLASTVENKDYVNGESYTTTDFVYIPSNTELGATEYEGTYEIGKVFDYFIDPDYKRYEAKIMGYPWTDDYWTRSPYSAGYRPVGAVITSGFIGSEWADAEGNGVRAVVNVQANAKISSEPNAEGIYEISY
jgi:hypothetical protein